MCKENYGRCSVYDRASVTKVFIEPKLNVTTMRWFLHINYRVLIIIHYYRITLTTPHTRHFLSKWPSFLAHIFDHQTIQNILASFVLYRLLLTTEVSFLGFMINCAIIGNAIVTYNKILFMSICQIFIYFFST